MSNLKYIDLSSSPIPEQRGALLPSPSTLKPETLDLDASPSNEQSTSEQPSFNRVGTLDFFGLPPEIRSMVYKLLFNNPYRCFVGRKLDFPVAGLKLLSVSKQTYEETFPLIYHFYHYMMNFSTPYSFASLRGSPKIDLAYSLSNISKYTLARMTLLIINLHVFKELASAPLHIEAFTGMKALREIIIVMSVDPWPGLSEAALCDMPFFVGLVVRITSHVPQHVAIMWQVYYNEAQSTSAEDSAKQYMYSHGQNCKFNKDGSSVRS